MKRYIKKLLSLLYNTRFSIHLIYSGVKYFYIGSRLKINKVKYVKCGDNLTIGRDSRLLFIDNYYGKLYYPMLEIGKNVTIGNRFTALVADKLIIEDNVLIASDVFITTEDHGTDPNFQGYAYQPLISKSVKLEKGCWIGEKVSILKGVTIGTKSIVATNSVVTKDVLPFTVVAGIPARVIRKYNFENKKWEKI